MQASIDSRVVEWAARNTGNVIYVIGKGPSLDEVELGSLPPGITINLNDSERILPGDVGVFSANWVRHSLKEEGFRCDFYLAGKPLPADVPHLVLPPIPIELDQDELEVVRINEREFFDESFLLLNALKLADRIGKVRREPQKVYLLGFDFTISGGSLSTKAGVDLSGATALEREAIIQAQENAFRQFQHYFAKGDRLQLVHVGTKPYSTLSPAAFGRDDQHKGLATVRREPVDLADPDRVLVVAELTNNHLGSAERLVKMVERATAAGADLIKVQKRHVDTFYTAEQLASYYWSPFGETLGDYRRGVELSDDLLDLLDATCKRCGIEWFCSVLDLQSYQALKRFSPRLIKIPSTISNHRDYHAELAADYKGAVVVSTGFTEDEYLDHVMSTYGDGRVVYLLHCISAYPTPAANCNIAVVRRYNELANAKKEVIPGYSSHDLGSLGCMLAVASGARMLEKHVKLGDVDWVHFDKVAIDLEGDEFTRFIADVRRTEEMMGDGVKRVQDVEHHKYKVANKA
ncbi:MAG: N-acetylneuraminate synthase family protein [Flavobacteriales bacterium]|nr:N-acetylneuraminate synthase family protein [Flavobacteriales bacterium]